MELVTLEDRISDLAGGCCGGRKRRRGCCPTNANKNINIINLGPQAGSRTVEQNPTIVASAPRGVPSGWGGNVSTPRPVHRTTVVREVPRRIAVTVPITVEQRKVQPTAPVQPRTVQARGPVYPGFWNPAVEPNRRAATPGYWNPEQGMAMKTPSPGYR